MTDYDRRLFLHAVRGRLAAGEKKPAHTEVLGNAAAPENAQSAFSLGQIAEIYDILDENGNVSFNLGTTGLTDNMVIE